MSEPRSTSETGAGPEETDLGRTVRDDAARAREEAKKEAFAQGERVQEQAAHRSATFADSLHAAADRLSNEDDMLARQVRSGADALGDFADRLHRQSLMDTVREAEAFGRRQPALLMGMAVALGFGLARAARAQPPERRVSQTGPGDLHQGETR